ncbi:MAG: DUF1345 domain-containing protein [Ferruginibacter sp.]
MATVKKSTNESLLLRIRPIYKMVISGVFSLVTYLILQNHSQNWKISALSTWIVFASVYLLLSWLIFFYCSKTQIKSHAGKEDGSRIFVSFLILISSFAGMLTVMLLIVGGSSENVSKYLLVIICLISMLSSWMMVHTTYAFHYAHLFYDPVKGTQPSEGLKFPQEKEPDYLDFAYFSFVIGMTFQVSDVEITSTTLRRQALLHSLISFGLNTFVVALTFNLIAGLIE